MTLSYNLAYQEMIFVHPTRRQIFAGRPYSTFPNIWEWLIFMKYFTLQATETYSAAMYYSISDLVTESACEFYSESSIFFGSIAQHQKWVAVAAADDDSRWLILSNGYKSSWQR